MRITLLLCVTVTLMTACNRDQVKISGRIVNAEKMTLYLDEVDVYENRPADSVVLNKRGSFSFAFDTRIPCFYQLRLSNGKLIALFPDPGQRIKIEANASNLIPSVKVDGSHNTEQAAKLIKSLHETKILLDSIKMEYEKTPDDSVRNRLNQEFSDILEVHRKFSKAFILTHYNSLASLYALYQQYQTGSYVFYKNTDLQFFKIVSDSLSKYIPDSRHVKALKAYTTNLLSDYNAQVILEMAGQPEASLPPVALPDMRGDTITLTSLKGKYVLLSFWASTDQNSVRQNLELKKVYNRYKDNGFEILQVSFDNSEENWIRAVRYDELPWISVIDSKFPNSVVAVNYNIMQIPANYLIGKDNVSILGKNLTPSQLQLKLEDILK